MECQYYRTFIGLPLRLEQGALEARCELLSAFEGERISWVEPENYHVTLRFLGDTILTDVKQIGSALRAGIKVPVRRHMELSEPGSFGPLKKPRVIWLGFEQTDFFDLLKNDVDRVLGECGVPFEKQPFRAHLTLGRVRSLQNLSKFYTIVDDMKQCFRSKVLFDRLVFYRSILGPRGPEYHVLEELVFS